MKIEKIRILAEELGLSDMIDECIRIRKYAEGEFSVFAKAKKRDAEKYEPMLKEQKKLILERWKLLMPEFVGWRWSYGRLSDGSCYISLWNPEFK